ncbi:hypothetical protein K435DRAFT_794908 [Dendrothele bispora CBS 962.96]|uniref:Uncharacterized protein n=1 Tax=Dendrothele bispora (strain CBS 962.96) TaxID=1314807 RepID=A0A4S8MAJ7_DENBC|nr:hypothetical protein K435DRAFT_794908 [Dendrothele bispora CBS 962.96]
MSKPRQNREGFDPSFNDDRPELNNRDKFCFERDGDIATRWLRRHYLGYHIWISGVDSVVRVEIWETSDSGEVLSRGHFGKTFGRFLLKKMEEFGSIVKET